ncbi:hypothetical protein MJH12_08090 [bacterium]|nr:hypothetical protein [bacterium]
MEKVPIVINCQQLEIDTRPSKSWVLEKLDHECYLEKLIKLAQESGYFNEIILVIPDDIEYQRYHSYVRDGVKVYIAKTSDYHLEAKHTLKAWNIHLSSHEYIPSWTYQICKSLQVEFVYTMDVYALFPSRQAIEKMIESARNNVGNYYVISGLNRIQAYIFPVKYLEKYYFIDTHLGRFKSLEYKSLKSPVKILDPLLKQNSFSSSNWASFVRKEGFQLIKSYFDMEKGEISLDLDLQNDFYLYINRNYREYIKTIHMEIFTKNLNIGLHKMLEDAADIGRLTIKFHISSQFEEWEKLMEVLSKINLHYILHTEGDIDQSVFNKILNTFHIVEFNLPDIDLERLKKQNTMAIDYDLVFTNFNSLCESHQKVGSPLIGVSCELPSNKLSELTIVKYWFERIDFCYPISPFHVIGDKLPKVQYINYYKEGSFCSEVKANKYELHLKLDEEIIDLTLQLEVVED